jgi:hypothetical protein
MKYISIIFLSLVLFSGCSEYNSPEIMSKNKLTFAGPGETVGTLPDGRVISRYRIDMGEYMHDHWIYVCSNTITVNTVQSQGKNGTASLIQVMVDGVKYTAPNMAEISDFK